MGKPTGSQEKKILTSQFREQFQCQRPVDSRRSSESLVLESGTSLKYSRFSVQNYEMGIVLPLPADDAEKAASEFAMWNRPPRKYDRDNDKPWAGGGLTATTLNVADPSSIDARRVSRDM